MRSIVLTLSALGALALGFDSAEAQRAPANTVTIDRGEFSVTPYGGYLLSQTFLSGPLNSKLNVQSAPLYGVQASLPLAPGAALVGGIAYASGNLEAGLPIIGGVTVGKSRTTLYDASVELRMERYAKNGRLIPLVQLGGGAIRRSVSISGIDAHTTDFQVSGGAGADFPMASGIALRFMAKDHYGKADFGSIAGLSAKTDDLHTLSLSGGVRIAF